MATNPYYYNKYDHSLPWEPQQYENSYTAARTNQRPAALQAQRSLQEGAGQKPKAAKPMPKARASGLIHTFKQWLVVASLAGFLTLGGLAAFHHVGTTASQTASAVSKTSSSAASSQKSSNGFLNQKGGNTSASTSSSKASTSSSTSAAQGSSNNSTSSSSTAVSGSNVS